MGKGHIPKLGLPQKQKTQPMLGNSVELPATFLSLVGLLAVFSLPRVPFVMLPASTVCVLLTIMNLQTIGYYLLLM